MSRETRLAKNTVILSIGTFLPKVAAFFTLPILTGFLTKEQYGIYDLITVLVELILPLATMQIHSAGFRFLVESKMDRKMAKLYLSNIFAFVIPVSIVSLGVVYFFLPTDDLWIRAWICIYLFFDAIVTEIRSIARGLSENLAYSISAIISAVFKMVFAFILVQIMKQQLIGAIIALALSPVFSIVYLVIKLRVYELIDFRLFDIRIIRKMLAYSWPMVPNSMSNWVMRLSDRFVITSFMGLAANAVYAAANKIPSLLNLAHSAFTLSWHENASIVSEDKDADEYYSKMFSIMMNVYAGALGAIMACTPLLFRILIKGDYSESYAQMPILFLADFFYCMSIFLGGIYIGYKATKSVGITTFVAAACNLFVDLFLIKKIGLYAASGSTLISYLLLFAYRLVDVRRLVKIKYNFKQIILISCILCVETILFYINTIYTNLFNVIIAVVVGYTLNRKLICEVWNRTQKLLARIFL